LKNLVLQKTFGTVYSFLQYILMSFIEFSNEDFPIIKYVNYGEKRVRRNFSTCL